MTPLFRQHARAVWRSRYSDLYDRYADRFLLDRVFGPLEIRTARRSPATGRHPEPYLVGEPPADLCFVVATSSGLTLCHGAALHRISAGRFFGITVRASRIYAFEQAGLHGHIVSFDLLELPARGRTHIWGFNKWIHQIDFIDNELAVVDTLHNRILVYDGVGERAPVHWSRYDREIAPAGRDRKGRKSPHHRQFNSIIRVGDKIHVVAHNDSSKTGRASEVWTLDKRWELLDVQPTAGHSCHNLVPHEDGLLMNWSLQRSLRLGNREVYRAPGFNRGLAYDGRHVLVGVSPFTADFADRERDAGLVDVLDSGFHPVSRVVFPGSSVRDLRLRDGDRGLSNYVP